MKIKDLGKCVTGRTPSSKTPTFYGGEIPFIRIPDLGDGRFIGTVEKTLTVEGLEAVHKAALPKGSVMVSCIATIGKVGITRESVSVTNQQINSIIPNEEIVDTEWLYYFFKDLGEDLAVFGGGGSVFEIISKSKFQDIEIDLPNRSTQETIADVLSSLDDKIDLLKRQNKTLEGMAETLFRQWFIEEAQDDWEVCTFGDFFQVKTGKKDANYSTEDGPYPFFTCSQEVSKSPDFSFNGKAILLAGNGNFNVKRYNGKFEAYQRTYVLIPEDPSLHAWLFFHLRFALQKIVMGSRGSVISFLTKGLIQNHEFTKPPELEKQKLDELDKLLEATDANDAQIKNLTLQRDTLLPKLMSGEVRVQMD